MLTLTIYRSGLLRRWRWRLTAANGEKIAASAQARGFSRALDCEENAVLTLTGERNTALSVSAAALHTGDSEYSVPGRSDVRVVREP